MGSLGSEDVMGDTGAAQVERALGRARPFLRGVGEKGVEKLVEVLRQTGASECWHKHGTFMEHLHGVYRILKVWEAPEDVALCGLFHSTYSNSYVNLALFHPDTEQQVVRDLVGDPAERLIHLFCIVPRHELIHDMLLFRFTDQDLLDAWQQRGSGQSLTKLRAAVPAQGLTVKHIRTGEDVHLSRVLVAQFLEMTMADFGDQLMGWQDTLFGNEDGTLRWPENNWTALWPGDGKPGLWMNSISRMGLLMNLIMRDESADAQAQLQLPPVFDKCTAILTSADEIKARDAYWDAVHLKGSGFDVLETAKPLLQQACELNPWIGEPHVVLAQVYLSQSKFDLAEAEASKGLRLLLEWGTNWDKRVSWECWVAWSRVLLGKAQEKTWPHDAWGIINLGLVK